jgi:hypothetical protein
MQINSHYLLHPVREDQKRNSDNEHDYCPYTSNHKVRLWGFTMSFPTLRDIPDDSWVDDVQNGNTEPKNKK